MQLSRRDVLKLGVLGSAALVLPMERVARTKLAEAGRLSPSQLPKPFVRDFLVPPVAQPVKRTLKDGRVVDYYDFVQETGQVQVLDAPFPKTTIWGYEGITPGPTIKVPAGTEVVVRQNNALPAVHPVLRYESTTSTHLHGSASLPQFDGYASDVTATGQSKYYLYPDFQEARTLWYHDHGVHHTAENAYMGLAAQYHLKDAIEGAKLPQGEFDVPLTVRDAIFGTDGQLIFDSSSESSLMGDVILVNGVPWPKMKVKRRTYRFRLLNASLSRSYRLALSNNQPIAVVGTDGGLTQAPQLVRDLRVGMAERYELVIDFSKLGPGQQVILKNLGLPNNVNFPSTANIMMFEVIGDTPDTTNNTLPATLFDHPVMLLKESDAVTRRRLEFVRQNGHWTVNGQTWDDVINSGFTKVVANPALNSVEVWDLVNKSGGWFHPVHIHLVDFQILSRNGRPAFAYERGPKDVAYVGENETVRVVARFGPQVGRYMIHCHNLVHEDHDMMVQFQVGAGGFDPRLAAPAEPTATLPPVEAYDKFPPDVPGRV
jgi:spore coat protein A